MVKLTDLSLVQIKPFVDTDGNPRRVLELVFECGQRVKVSPESLIAFAERAIRQAEAAKDNEPSREHAAER